jgi:hypothetical protein
MATYLYETIPADPDELPETFEVRQGMNDAPLSRHPETGVPVRRVITGGFGYMPRGNPSAPQPPSPRGGGGCCGGGCGCSH